jgi:hypothetical protein
MTKSRWMVMLIHEWGSIEVELWGMKKAPTTHPGMGDGFIVVFDDEEAAKREFPDAKLVEVVPAP